MNKIFQISLCGMALLLSTSTVQSKEWSLKDCIHYALTHNISLQKKTLQHLSAQEDTPNDTNVLNHKGTKHWQDVTHNIFSCGGNL